MSMCHNHEHRLAGRSCPFSGADHLPSSTHARTTSDPSKTRLSNCSYSSEAFPGRQGMLLTCREPSQTRVTVRNSAATHTYLKVLPFRRPSIANLVAVSNDTDVNVESDIRIGEFALQLAETCDFISSNVVGQHSWQFV